ncbi:MAG: KH domain-containing protein [Nanoarchaeota archaeon]
MQEIYVENIKGVLSNKKKFEKELKVRISNKGKNIFVSGNPEKEYIAIRVLEAVKVGFSLNKTLQLKQEEMMLQILNIKDLTKRQDLKIIRSRVIGTGGRTLKTLKNLTNCDLSLYENQIGIIGDAEEVEDAVQAISSLVKGSKHGNVYARLEKRRRDKGLESRKLNFEVNE